VTLSGLPDADRSPLPENLSASEGPDSVFGTNKKIYEIKISYTLPFRFNQFIKPPTEIEFLP